MKLGLYDQTQTKFGRRGDTWMFMLSQLGGLVRPAQDSIGAESSHP